jgi:hypothetical protein
VENGKQLLYSGEPNELVANLLTPVARWGKLADWKNGYGKYTVAIILLHIGYNVYQTGFPMITTKNRLGSLYTNATDVFLFLMALYIYKSSFKNNKNLLIINSKGIFYEEKTFFWNDILSFQLSLEKEMNKHYHVYYLHLGTNNKMNHKIDIRMYNKKFAEIHDLCLKIWGKRR